MGGVLDGVAAASIVTNRIIIGTGLGALAGAIVKVKRTVYEAPVPPALPVRTR